LCSYRNARDQVWHQYKTGGKIVYDMSLRLDYIMILSPRYRHLLIFMHLFQHQSPNAWKLTPGTFDMVSGRPIPRPEEPYRLWCLSEYDQVKNKNLDTYCV
jgi:hypothetical protein